MKSAAIVVEIGSTWLKLVGLTQQVRRQEIVKLAVKNIGYMPDDLVAKVLSMMVKEMKLKPNPLVVSFPRGQVTVRNLKFPSTNQDELEEMVKIHAERQSPYSKEEIISGYQIIGTDDVGYTKGILAIAHRDNVKRVFKILEDANLYSERVELSSQGVMTWFSFAKRLTEKEKAQNIILLDIDFNFTDLQIISGNSLLGTRSISMGADNLTDEAKHSKFIADIRQSLITAQSESMMDKPARMFIGGALSRSDDIKKSVEKEFGFSIEIVSPFKNIPMSKQCLSTVSSLPNDISFSAVLGLALDTKKKRITLIPPEVKVRKMLKERTREITVLGIIVVYLFVAFCGIFWERMYAKQSYLNEINSHIEEIKDETQKLADMRQEVRLAKKRLNMAGSALNYIHNTHKLIPAEITIERINFEEGEKLNLRGSARLMSDIFKFITALENSDYFERIETKFTTQEKTRDGTDISKFEISCPLIK